MNGVVSRDQRSAQAKEGQAMTEPMTRGQVNVSRDEATRVLAKDGIGCSPEMAVRFARALLATMTELEQVKAELHITERLLRSEAETTLELRAALSAMTEREGVLSDMLKKAANRLDWCACLLHTDTARDQASTWAEETRAALRANATDASEGER